PVLNLKLDLDLKRMRTIAEEAFAMVREYKGSHSGEHGDGIVRSEFHDMMFGRGLVRAFNEVKDLFDPEDALNPHRIVDPPDFDDRNLLRYGPDYQRSDFKPVLDWSAWPGGAAGFQGAAEMCNNNGACRKSAGGVMCPSYRVTRDERDVTRGRANTLRLALSGQLGPEALTSEHMRETLSLCVSCKACRRECPTGVDLARMKIEVQAARAAKHGFSLRDRIVAHLPDYAEFGAALAPLLNLRDRVPVLARASEKVMRMAHQRPLPRWRRDRFRAPAASVGEGRAGEVVLFADTFNRAFERETIEAALKVLLAANYRVHLPRAMRGKPALCCGRTHLSVGNVAGARRALARTRDALLPFALRGVPIVGLEPSCLLTLRDELPALFPDESSRSIGDQALLFEEFLTREADAGKLALPLHETDLSAHLHGHCHQKAFGAFGAVEAALRLVPGLDVKPIESSCCGMAGAFGYQAETYDVSMAMGELTLFPAVRGADMNALIVADGFSCRHQIEHGAGRKPAHVADVLAAALRAPTISPRRDRSDGLSSMK
ncbi:MAG: 4Fe-4S dicluster domain-containing protein, partial [Methylobacteriaceae bacterium]|nr:4Fe-4S dicluster domain-containing protein [Methylobacteriaceae bacterium]